MPTSFAARTVVRQVGRRKAKWRQPRLLIRPSSAYLSAPTAPYLTGTATGSGTTTGVLVAAPPPIPTFAPRTVQRPVPRVPRLRKPPARVLFRPSVAQLANPALVVGSTVGRGFTSGLLRAGAAPPPSTATHWLSVLDSFHPTAHWRLEEIASPEGTADERIRNLDGEYTGFGIRGAAPFAGSPLWAFDTNGGTGWMVAPDDMAIRPGSGNWAAGFVMVANSLPATGYVTLVRKRVNGPYLQLLPTGALQLNWFDGAFKFMLTDEGVISRGVPYFVGFEVDELAEQARIYVDGRLVAEDELTISPGIYSVDPLVWGANTEVGGSIFDGVLDEAWVKVGGTLIDDEGWAALDDAIRYPALAPIQFKDHHAWIAIGGSPDFSQLATDAVRYDVIVLQHWQTSARDTIKAASPSTKVLAYQNFGHIHEGEPDATASSCVRGSDAIEDWFAHDSLGARVDNPSFPWLQYADVGDSDYWAAVVAQVSARLLGWDGAFLDDVNPRPSGVDEGDLVEYPTNDDYRIAVGRALPVVAAGLNANGLLVAANVGRWHENPAIVEPWLQSLDYAMNEQGLRFSGSGVFAYYGYVNNTIRGAVAAERYGCAPVVTVPFAPAEVEAARYGVGLMLIVSEGRTRLATPYLSGGASDYNRTSWDAATFDVAWLGKPAAAASMVYENVWYRPYGAGAVYVNAGDVDATFKLADGLSRSGFVTMAPKTALLLRLGVPAVIERVDGGRESWVLAGRELNVPPMPQTRNEHDNPLTHTSLNHTLPDGFSGLNSSTLTPETTVVPPWSTESCKVAWGISGSASAFYQGTPRYPIVANQTVVMSMYVYIPTGQVFTPSGDGMTVNDQGQIASKFRLSFSSANFSLRDTWQRVYVCYRAAATDVDGFGMALSYTGTNDIGAFVYTTGWMIEYDVLSPSDFVSGDTNGYEWEGYELLSATKPVAPWRIESGELAPGPKKPRFAMSETVSGGRLAGVPASDFAQWTFRMRLQKQTTMEEALQYIADLSDSVQVAERSESGTTLVRTPHTVQDGAIWSTTYRVVLGEVLDIPEASTGEDQGFFTFQPVVTVKLTCEPYGEMPPLESDVDHFADSTSLDRYEQNTEDSTVAGGVLVLNSTSTRRGLLNDLPYPNLCDVQVTMKVNIGASGATWSFRVGARCLDMNNFLYAQMTQAGQLGYGRVINGSATSLGTTTGATVLNNSSGWLRLRLEGDRITAAWYLTDPVANPAAVPEKKQSTLLDSNSQQYRNVSGRVCWHAVAGSADGTWTLDDFTVEPNVYRTVDTTDQQTPPLISGTIRGIPGDAPARGHIIVRELSNTARRFLEGGAGPDGYRESAGVEQNPLVIDSDSMVVAGYTGVQSSTALSYAYDPNASGNKTIKVTCYAGTLMAACGLGTWYHSGTYRVHLRAFAVAGANGFTGCLARLRWRDKDGRSTPNAWATIGEAGASTSDVRWLDLDLGLVEFNDIGINGTDYGVQSWTGSLELLHEMGGDVYIDEVELIPSDDAYFRANAAASSEPGSLVGVDDFTSTTAGNNLAGRVAAGGTWTSAGGTLGQPDFKFVDSWPGLPSAPGAGPEGIFRNSINDTTAPQYALLDTGATKFSDVSVGMWMGRSTSGGASVDSGKTIQQGLLLRFVDTGNFLMVGISATKRTLYPFTIDTVFFVSKMESAAIIPLASVEPDHAGQSGNSWYFVTIDADSNGAFVATMSTFDGGVVATVTGSDSALAAGGGLDDGLVGFFDSSTNNITTVGRYYDMFTVATPAPIPLLLPPSRDLHITDDTFIRASIDGTTYGEPFARGTYMELEPAGQEDRVTRVAMRAHQNDLLSGRYQPLGADISMQVLYTPRTRLLARR